MEPILTAHARQSKRGIQLEWIKLCLAKAESVEDQTDGNRHYLRSVPDFRNRVLRVVVNETTEPSRVVTAFFDRRVSLKK